MNFVTDTHALLWWFIDSPKIGPKASEIFQKCEKGENIIFIPSIVIAEGLSIFEKKRISFDFKNSSEKYMKVKILSSYPLITRFSRRWWT
jgi:PIN domain nuclease of toxin-antitoxin system